MALLLPLLLASHSNTLLDAFVVPTMQKTIAATSRARTRQQQQQQQSLSSSRLYNSLEEAERLLELARKMRQEVAALENKSVEQVEEEATQARLQRQQREEATAQHRQQMRAESQSQGKKSKKDGRFLSVPETPEDQVLQAKAAVERAFANGLTRQIVRFALVPRGETLNSRDRQWPGGARQMYREAAGPLARDLLRQVRAPTTATDDDDDDDDDSPSRDVHPSLRKPPTVKSQDVWDFDGSALVTAEASTGARDDVQALVFPNTDTKYTQDIAQIDQAMGPQRLFLLVNPFWRNIDSWGFNLLAPKGKQLAQQAIFDRGFVETYSVLQKTVQGEDCVALKAYPYDWQLYAYAESDYWPYEEYTVHLGSTVEEPTSNDFVPLLSEREEFKMSKNMRMMQRMMKKDE
jgi:hypothetical protein